MEIGKLQTSYFDCVSLIFSYGIYWSLFCKQLKNLVQFLKICSLERCQNFLKIMTRYEGGIWFWGLGHRRGSVNFKEIETSVELRFLQPEHTFWKLFDFTVTHMASRLVPLLDSSILGNNQNRGRQPWWTDWQSSSARPDSGGKVHGPIPSQDNQQADSAAVLTSLGPEKHEIQFGQVRVWMHESAFADHRPLHPFPVLWFVSFLF